MNLRRIEYFVTAAECGNFTLAAQKMYTNQPNLSKQIALLEREVGVPLFFREHRSVTLTPEGQLFYERVKEIPNCLQSACEEVRQLQKTERQALHIGILEGHQISENLLLQMAAFHDTHPDYVQTISRCEFDQLREGLENHQFDLIFTILFTVEKKPYIQTRVLYSQRTFVAVNTRNVLSEKEMLTWEQLRKERFLLLEEQQSPVSFHELNENLRNAGIRKEQVTMVGSTEALFTSVESNLGIAIVDEINRLRSSPYVRLIPLEETTSMPDFGLAWLKSNKKKQVYEFVSDIIAGIEERIKDTEK
jgi:DNA-binding transcriptional LysR family regulator